MAFASLVALALSSSSGVAAPTPLVPPHAAATARPQIAVGKAIVLPAAAFVAADDAALADALTRDAQAEVFVVRRLVLDYVLVAVPAARSADDTRAVVERLAYGVAAAHAEVDAIWRPLRRSDDALVDFMWHIDAMRLPQAWDVTIGRTGSRIGIVDTGLVAHDDLSIAGAIDFISDAESANDGDGRDSDGTDDCDPDSHGTHVAGIAAARGDNGLGVVGSSWRAQVTAVRALGCDGGFTSDINEGAVWLTGGDVPGVTPLSAAERARVVNLSLGGEPGVACSRFSADVFADLDRRGAIVVAAAGNDPGPVGSPANCGGVITVAASDRDGFLASYSSFGPEVDVVAAGGDQGRGDTEDGVLSTVRASRSDFDSGIPYAFFQGTSMATPLVTGVISLMLEVDPSLTRIDVESILRRTGRVCGDCQGKSLLDAGAALAFVSGNDNVAPPGCTDTCRFAFDGECDDGRAGAVSAVCDPGTDCGDCDPAAGLPACTERNNGCRFADDDECDEPDVGTGACEVGSDGNDCGLCVADDEAGGGGDGGGDGGTCDDSCEYANDGECDDDGNNSGYCADQTDCTDCDGLSAEELRARARRPLCGAGAAPTSALGLALGLVVAVRHRRRQRR